MAPGVGLGVPVSGGMFVARPLFLFSGCFSSVSQGAHCTIMTLSMGARNAITGLGLAAFVGGVFLYSMRAVKQEDFSDVDARLAKEKSNKAPAGYIPGSNRG